MPKVYFTKFLQNLFVKINFPSFTIFKMNTYFYKSKIFHGLKLIFKSKGFGYILICFLVFWKVLFICEKVLKIVNV